MLRHAYVKLGDEWPTTEKVRGEKFGHPVTPVFVESEEDGLNLHIWWVE